MKIIQEALNGILVLEPTIFGDARGFFYESYNRKTFAELGIKSEFVQDNISRSAKGVLRGLHYQLNPFAQGKLIRVSQGEVFDVAVDIRKGSPTYGKWHGEIISVENQRLMWIPPGFAHGFQVLSDVADFNYKVTNYYSSVHDRSLFWNDPTIGVEWKNLETGFILSEKDKKGKLLAEIETNFVF